jgi:LysR family transcriptional regulator for metE and metH
VDLELRHLKLVIELSETGSATRAAERLHVTQSAVSHQLREIEARLGTRLFLRVGKRMLSTAAGERVLRSARSIIGSVEQIEDDVRRLAGHGEGVLRVCAECHTGYHWLPPLLQAFEQRHPRIEVQIAVECTMTPIESLLDGKLDVALVTRAVTDPRIRRRPLFTDEHAAIVAAHHPLASRTYLAPADLASETLLLYSASLETSFTIREVLRPAGVMPARVQFVQLTEAILEMVKAGRAVSVLPTWSIQPALRAGTVRAIRLTRRGVHRQWSAATLVAREDPPFLSYFLDLLAAQALPVRAATGTLKRAVRR